MGERNITGSLPEERRTVMRRTRTRLWALLLSVSLLLSLLPAQALAAELPEAGQTVFLPVIEEGEEAPAPQARAESPPLDWWKTRKAPSMSMRAARLFPTTEEPSSKTLTVDPI